jgi:periplasmic copper chaperone A
MMIPIRVFAFVAGLVVASAAFAQISGLEISSAWARATPGKAQIGAVYLTIVSPTADKLVSAATPAAKKAELHTMTMTGMVMKMRPLAALDIPAGQSVTLKPGGMHIMLIGLVKALHQGQSFPLTLTFAKAGTRTVEVEVEKPGAMGAAPGPQP